MAKTSKKKEILYLLRLPPDVHKELKIAAKLATRSLHGEILDRLKTSIANQYLEGV